MAKELTPAQLEKLLQYASRRLNTSPEALIKAFQQSGLTGVAEQAQGTAAFTPQEAQQAQALLQNPAALEQWMNSPAMRQLLSQLLGDQ